MKAIELFQVNIQRSEELLDLHKTSFPIGRPVSKGPPADLLRAVIVFTVATLDAYIHKNTIERVKKVIHFEKRIPEKCVELIKGKFKEKDGYREILNLVVQSDPENKLLHFIEEALSLKTFQKPDQIDFVFKMSDLKDSWKQINKLSKPNRGPKRKGRRQTAQAFLLALAKRRDEIVHKNDMYVYNKYHGKIRPIGRKEVSDSLKNLRRIVLAIERIS